MLKYFAVILLFLLFSCNSKPKERRIAFDEVVDYRKVLFEGSESLPSFKLSKKRTILDSLKANNYWFDDSFRIEYNWFKLKLSNRLLKVGANKFNPPPGVFPRDVIQFVVNRNNQFMLNMVLIDSIGKIDSSLYRELNKRDFKFLEHLIFQWDEESDLEVIDSVFNEIEQGYTLFYDSIARHDYKAPIHNLSVNQLQNIQKKYPFDVVILVKNRPTQFGSDKRFFQGFYYE